MGTNSLALGSVGSVASWEAMSILGACRCSMMTACLPASRPASPFFSQVFIVLASQPASQLLSVLRSCERPSPRTPGVEKKLLAQLPSCPVALDKLYRDKTLPHEVL